VNHPASGLIGVSLRAMMRWQDRQPIEREACRSSLLPGMGDLVRKQVQATSIIGSESALAEVNILADGECARAKRLCGIRGLRASVNSNLRQVRTKRAFEHVPRPARKGIAARAGRILEHIGLLGSDRLTQVLGSVVVCRQHGEPLELVTVGRDLGSAVAIGWRHFFFCAGTHDLPRLF
jgi:hypothetical protein